MWVGTGYDGLNSFDPATGTFSRYPSDPDNPNSPSEADIFSLHLDDGGILWMGMYNRGLSRFDPATGTFTHYPYEDNTVNSLTGRQVNSFAAAPDGTLWIATNNGLNRFDPSTETFTNYLSDLRDPNSLALAAVRAVYVDGEGIVWIGTRSGGLDRLDPATDIFTHYGKIPGIPAGVHQILADEAGNLWLTGRQGIARFNPQTEQVDIFDYRQGVQNFDSWQMGAQLKAGDGQFYFGSYAGLQVFHPDEIETNMDAPPYS